MFALTFSEDFTCLSSGWIYLTLYKWNPIKKYRDSWFGALCTSMKWDLCSAWVKIHYYLYFHCTFGCKILKHLTKNGNASRTENSIWVQFRHWISNNFFLRLFGPIFGFLFVWIWSLNGLVNSILFSVFVVFALIIICNFNITKINSYFLHVLLK